MRQDVTFHNGQTGDRNDAWLSIQRVADPRQAAIGGGQLSRSSTSSPPRSSTTDALIVLKTPYAILDSLLAEYTLGIIPGGEFDPANPVGTGAFTYKSFEAGKTSTFTKYADYWGDAAFLESSRSRTSPTTTPRSTRSRPARSRPSTTCPTTSSTRSRAPVAAC